MPYFLLGGCGLSTTSSGNTSTNNNATANGTTNSNTNATTNSNNTTSSTTNNNCNNTCKNTSTTYCATATPEQVVLASAAISIAITQGRTANEIETLLNLTYLINQNVQRILAQKLICERDQTNLEVTI